MKAGSRHVVISTKQRHVFATGGVDDHCLLGVALVAYIRTISLSGTVLQSINLTVYYAFNGPLLLYLELPTIPDYLLRAF